MNENGRLLQWHEDVNGVRVLGHRLGTNHGSSQQKARYLTHTNAKNGPLKLLCSDHRDWFSTPVVGPLP